MNKTQETVEYLLALLKSREDIIGDDDPVQSITIERAYILLEMIHLNSRELLK